MDTVPPANRYVVENQALAAKQQPGLEGPLDQGPSALASQVADGLLNQTLDINKVAQAAKNKDMVAAEALRIFAAAENKAAEQYGMQQGAQAMDQQLQGVPPQASLGGPIAGF